MNDDVVTCEATSSLLNVLLLQDRQLIFSQEIIEFKKTCSPRGNKKVQILMKFSFQLLIVFNFTQDTIYDTVYNTNIQSCERIFHGMFSACI